MIGVSFEEWCAEMGGGWLHGYIKALDAFGVRTVLVVWSRGARRPHRRLHVPTGAEVWVLPATRTHRAARRVRRHLSSSPRWTGRLLHAASLAVGYSATQPRELVQVLRQERCGAVLVQEYEYPRFDVCVLLGRWLGLPVFATFQGGARPDTRVEGRIRRWTVPAAAGLFIGARREAAAVAKRYQLDPGIVNAVPNPIDVDEWRPGDQTAARMALGLPLNVPIACWHGRIQIQRKGLDLLVKAWRLVCAERRGTDLRLLMCGTGAESARLRRSMSAAGLRGVHWRDEYVTDRAIVRRQLAASDVFVLPSRHEGFAVAPMEAMACGRPVVACNTYGVKDLLAGGKKSGGFVVPATDFRALARTMGRLLDNRALASQLGEAARYRIVKLYSAEAVGGALVSALHLAAPEHFPAPAVSD